MKVIFDLLALASSIYVLAGCLFVVWHGLAEVMRRIEIDDLMSFAALGFFLALIVLIRWIKTESYQ